MNKTSYFLSVGKNRTYAIWLVFVNSLSFKEPQIHTKNPCFLIFKDGMFALTCSSRIINIKEKFHPFTAFNKEVIKIGFITLLQP